MIRNKPLTLWNWLSTKIDKSYLKLLGMVLGAVGLIFLIIILFPGTPEKQLPFGDIMYYRRDYKVPYQRFMNEENGKWKSGNFIVTREINVFGSDIQIQDLLMKSWIVTSLWSPDGNSIGFSYNNDESDGTHPGVLNIDGKVYTCPQIEDLYTSYGFPVVPLDSERIVINMGDSPANYLAQYNLRTCEKESIFFDGKDEGIFAISSNGWLAVSETIDGQYFINVYDEQKNLVHSKQLVYWLEWTGWSLDGTQLLYRDYLEMSSMVYSYNILTGETSQIGENTLNVSYSPDGNRIAYHKDDGIYILDLESGQEQFLVEGTLPKWRP